MHFLGLRTTIYRVPDLEAAKIWYSDVLGFGPYFDQPFYVGYEVGGYELGLQPFENTTATPSQTVQTYWGVKDVPAMFERLTGMGATAYEHPANVGDNIVVAMVLDPWGNLFGMIDNPHFH